MNDRIVDTVARNTAAVVNRRTSLLSMVGAALAAAVSGPTLAKPGKSRRNAAKRCKRQQGQCLAAIAAYCASLELPQVCQGFLSPCCEPLAQCNAGETTACLLSFLTS